LFLWTIPALLGLVLSHPLVSQDKKPADDPIANRPKVAGKLRRHVVPPADAPSPLGPGMALLP
jgi:hypothetical protein